MKKQLITLISCSLLYIVSCAQTADYRTTEDGVTQLMNNVDFLDRMSKMSNQQLLDMNVETLIGEYVPEYKGFKMELDKLDLNKVYYGGGSGYNTQQLANGLGKVLGMNEKETTDLNGVLSGQYNFTDVRQSGSYISNQLYQKGKHEGVDYVVDNTNSALQKQFGDGNASAVIDIGTGLLGNFLFNLTQEDEAVDPEKERQAKEAATRYEAYRLQQNSLLDKASEAEIYANKQAYAHSYVDAIKGYTEAIGYYRQTEYGGYSVIKCYRERAKAKVETDDYRGGVVDFYLGLNAFGDVANGKIKWIRNELTTAEEEMWGFVRGRAYAKYKAGDFNGALADCNLLLSAMQKSDAKKYDWKNGAVQYDPFSYMPQNTLLNDIMGIMGMVYIAQGKYAEAVGVLKYNKSFVTMQNFSIRLDELPRTFHREVMLAKTVAYYKVGNYTESLKEYDKYIDCKQWIKMQGGNVSAGYSGRGNVHMAMGNYKAALDDYNTAVDLEPTEASYYLNRANCKLLLGDKEGAKADAGLFKNPTMAAAQKKSVSYYWNRYSTLLDKTNHAAVIALLDSALADHPNDESFLGLMLSQINSLGNAEKTNYYKQKYATNTMYGSAFKAVFLLQMNDNTQAYAAILEALSQGLPLNSAVTLFPGIPAQPDYCNLLKLYQGNLSKVILKSDEGVKVLKEGINAKLKTVEADPTQSLSLAIYYLNSGDGENALKYIEKYAGGMAGHNVVSLEYKINALFMLGRTQDAVQVARAFYVDNKDGLFKDMPQMKVIGNIAANHCGFSTLPPPAEPKKEEGKKKR